jgi:hypothetical protein
VSSYPWSWHVARYTAAVAASQTRMTAASVRSARRVLIPHSVPRGGWVVKQLRFPRRYPTHANFGRERSRLAAGPGGERACRNALGRHSPQARSRTVRGDGACRHPRSGRLPPLGQLRSRAEAHVSRSTISRRSACSCPAGADELGRCRGRDRVPLSAVLALSVGSRTNTTFILSVQLIRTFVMLLAAPPLARWIPRRWGTEVEAGSESRALRG